MRSLLVRLVAPFFLFSVLLGSAVPSHASTAEATLAPPPPAHGACDQLFLRKLSTLEQLIVTAEDGQPQGLLATHWDYDHDRKLSNESWFGEPGPLIFRGLLPDNVNFIEHQQRDPTERSLVKADNGELVLLRYNAKYKGQWAGTNIAVRETALMDNLDRTQKLLVSRNAKAVNIYFHGGGTATTGATVAGRAMNYFAGRGVDVISMDLPWHGGGSRYTYESVRDFFEWFRQMLREQVVPAGKPIFLTGHSMGAELADLYMRMYPNDDLVSGFLPVSGVPDMSPGASVEERIRRLPEMMAVFDDPALKAKIAPKDLELMDSIPRQNKLSPWGLWFESLFAISKDWKAPPNGGADLKPARYYWGRGDYLYVGKEKLIDDNVRALQNASLVTYGQAPTLNSNGKPTVIGHTNIFDMDGDVIFEDMRSFIANVIGVELPEVKEENAEGVSRYSTLLRKFAKTYANNLGFREFLKQVRYRKRLEAPDVSLETLQSREKALVTEEKTLVTAQRNLAKANKQGGPEFAEVGARLAAVALELNSITPILRGTVADPGTEEAFRAEQIATDDLNKRYSVENKIYLKDREKFLVKQAERDELMQDLMERLVPTKGSPPPPGPTNEALQPLVAEREAAYADLGLANGRLEKAVGRDHGGNLELRGGDYVRRNAEPSAELRPVVAEYYQISARYQQTNKALFEAALTEALEGRLTPELQWHAKNALAVRQRVENDRFDLDQRESALLNQYEEIEVRRANIVRNFQKTWFRMQDISVDELLRTTPSEEWMKYNRVLTDTWSRWQRMWNVRPRPDKTQSLY